MVRRVAVAALVLALSAPFSVAQQPASPMPLIRGGPPSMIEPAPLLPRAGGAEFPAPPRPADASPPPAGASLPAAEPDAARVFCDQPVTARLADRNAVPDRYRAFIGMWSDAAWTPQQCAALIVENVSPDGIATIVYVFGPLGPSPRAPRGVLNGTGIVRSDELKFQNSDGSQFAFRPLYSDLEGRLTTPQGQNYQTIFKKTF